MNLPISLTPMQTSGCDVLEASPNRLRFRVTDEKAYIRLPSIPAGSITSGYTLFTAILDNDSDRGCTLYFNLFCTERRCAYTLRTMPRVRCDLLFRTKYLDGSRVFPPMEPGTLKSGAGSSILPEEITDIDLTVPGAGVTYTIENMRFTDIEPDYCKPDRAMCDELGQWNEKDWPGKTASLSELRQVLDAELAGAAPENAQLDAYGGDKRFPIAEPSDAFVTVKRDGKWWLATPEGNAFYSLGVFGVYPGEYGWVHGNEGWIGKLPSHEGEFAESWTLAETEELYRRKFSGCFPADTRLHAFATANLIRVWGKDWRKNWTTLTANRLHRWSMNTLSMFSDPHFVRDSGIPYVIMLKKFPVTDRFIFREFPDVFDPAYGAASEVYASQLADHADNPRLIGYFMNNEPIFAWSNEWTLAEKLLECGGSYHSHKVLVDWLREKYTDIAALGKAWNLPLTDWSELSAPILRASERSEAAKADLSEFSAILMRRYVELPAQACRKAAPKRLNLGMRFAGISPLTLKTVDFFDVYSVNCYKLDPTVSLDAVAEKADLPVLIGEFHFGSFDAGLPEASINRTVSMPTQADRAAAYQRYIRAAAAHPNSVGAHWFAYNDQPLWGRYDCENFQFGFVDVCNRPYRVFTDAVAEANRELIENRMK